MPDVDIDVEWLREALQPFLPENIAASYVSYDSEQEYEREREARFLLLTPKALVLIRAQSIFPPGYEPGFEAKVTLGRISSSRFQVAMSGTYGSWEGGQLRRCEVVLDSDLTLEGWSFPITLPSSSSDYGRDQKRAWEAARLFGVAALTTE